uniref:hypothetical protein n=1 Tax=Sphingomonas sp. TaxID=28214 RepID=UPI0015EEE6D6|nr:hypothetical protein [Sphingomonas sp.]
MDIETVIRREIAQLEASPLVVRLRGLNAALDALTQTMASGGKKIDPVAVIRKKSGLPKSWARALRLLPDSGLTFADYRDQYGQDRGSPIAEGSFAAQLSKMKAADLIHKRGDRWFAGILQNEPGADLQAGTPGSSEPSNEETANADNNI